MKKISTAAAKQTRNFQDQKLTIGLDLGDRTSWYCVLNGAGEVLLEQKLSTTPKAMKEAFGVSASLRRLFASSRVNETVRWAAVRGDPIGLGTLLKSHKEFRIGCTSYFLHG